MDERCGDAQQFREIDAAFRQGDLAALRAAVDDPVVVPNGPITQVAIFKSQGL